MALQRTVKMPDGIVRRFHEITGVNHVLNNATYIEIDSYQYDKNESESYFHTTLTHDFDDTLTYAAAYDYISGLPEFAEVAVDSDAELVEMNGKITELNATLAQKEERLGELDAILNLLTPEQAVQVAHLYPEWQPNTDYHVDDKVAYNDQLLVCVEDHTSQQEQPQDEARWTAAS